MSCAKIDFENLLRYGIAAETLFAGRKFSEGRGAGGKLWRSNLFWRVATCRVAQCVAPQMRPQGDHSSGADESFEGSSNRRGQWSSPVAGDRLERCLRRSESIDRQVRALHPVQDAGCLARGNGVEIGSCLHRDNGRATNTVSAKSRIESRQPLAEPNVHLLVTAVELDDAEVGINQPRTRSKE